MTIDEARNSEKRQEFLMAIRQKMNEDENAQLRPSEAVMMLEWAVECDEYPKKAELLNIFAAMGGLKLMKDAFARMN